MKAYLTRYLQAMQEERHLSFNTLASYERDLLAFFAFAETQGVTKPEEAGRQLFSRYLLLLNEQGKKPSTLSRHIVSVRSFFQFLAKSGVIEHNHSIYMVAPKQVKQQPIVLSVDQTAALLDSPNSATASGMRDKAMLELLYATGIRVSELVALNITDVHRSLGYIGCNGGGMNERIVPYGRMAAGSLDEYIMKGRNELLSNRDADSALFLNHLGTRMTRQGFWKIIKKHAKAAGFEEDITPHTLRHSVAVHMLDNGADIRAVQELLGHADLSSTLKYTQLPKLRLKDAYSKSHPRA